MLVMTNDYSDEELKDLLVGADDDFFLMPSAIGGDYQVLRYRLPNSRNGRPRNCKVDIVLPGTMDLPWIHPSRIVNLRPSNRSPSLPCMPLQALLIMKLRGWSDHRHSDRSDFQAKIPVDEDDIDQLLDICVGDDIRINRACGLSYPFRKLGFRLARTFVNANGQDDRWRQLGYNV
jgi:hypothetical protein